jgi:hypothetical protein
MATVAAGGAFWYMHAPRTPGTTVSSSHPSESDGPLKTASLVSSSAHGVDLFRKDVQPLLKTYCYDCHGEGTKKGDLALDKFQSLDAHLNNIELWFNVWKNVQSQLMPPADKQQPAPEKRQGPKIAPGRRRCNKRASGKTPETLPRRVCT